MGIATMLDALVAPIGGDEKAHTVTVFAELRIIRRAGKRHLRRLHLRRIVFREQLLSVVFALVHVKEKIVTHVFGVAVELASGTEGASVRAGRFKGHAF